MALNHISRLLRGFKHGHSRKMSDFGLKSLRWVRMKKSEIQCEENLVCGQLTVQIATFISKISASRFSPSYHANVQNPAFFAKGHVLTPVEKGGMAQGPDFLQTDIRLDGLNITKIAALYSTPSPPKIALKIKFNTIRYSVFSLFFQ